MRCLFPLILLFLLFAVACKKKNNLSKIPQISFLEMLPDSIKAGSSADTLFIYFDFKDGDADLGNKDPNGKDYDIYFNDKRFDTGYQGYFFPSIDASIEDASLGISGTGVFKMLAANIAPRTDSIHKNFGDTTYYEIYIKDRAGNISNHINTPVVYIRP
jgi:hypothetical protein